MFGIFGRGSWGWFWGFLLTWAFNRMDKRRQAMLEMPELIREWKKVRFGRPVFAV
jgi:hypothetical protein